MYTMYNSPSPALRQQTAFYDTDLKVVTLQFMPGPGNNTLTITRFLNIGWDFVDVVSTTQPVAAPKRALPPHARAVEIDRPSTLVQAVQDCAGVQVRRQIWVFIGAAKAAGARAYNQGGVEGMIWLKGRYILAPATDCSRQLSGLWLAYRGQAYTGLVI